MSLDEYHSGFQYVRCCRDVQATYFIDNNFFLRGESLRTLFIGSFVLIASVASAQTRFEPIHFSHPATLQLAGDGIVLPTGFATRLLRDSKGNRVQWRAKGTDIDESGVKRRHMAYHQVVNSPWGEVPIDGTELRLHHDDNDVLRTSPT